MRRLIRLLLVTTSPASIESGVSILTIVFGCIVASTPFVALGEMAATDIVALSAKKSVNIKVSILFIYSLHGIESMSSKFGIKSSCIFSTFITLSSDSPLQIRCAPIMAASTARARAITASRSRRDVRRGEAAAADSASFSARPDSPPFTSSSIDTPYSRLSSIRFSVLGADAPVSQREIA